jgi:hypothetical protein
MSTTVETTVEHDPREEPGGGRLNHVSHVVRIVVVRDAESPDARQSREAHESHGLKDDELRRGEARLKRMAPPPKDDGSARQGSSGPAPTNMFDTLKPTDIVAIGREAASVRVVDKHGKPVPLDENGQPVPRDNSGQRALGSTAAAPEPPTRRLFGHDDGHKDTVLRVWTESDTVEYQCDTKFEIVKVEKAGWKIFRTTDDLFEREKHREAIEEKNATIDASGNPKSVWKWKSGLIPDSANNQQYKMTFRIFDERGEKPVDVDPDIVCGDPPPVPGP